MAFTNVHSSGTHHTGEIVEYVIIIASYNWSILRYTKFNYFFSLFFRLHFGTHTWVRLSKTGVSRDHILCKYVILNEEQSSNLHQPFFWVITKSVPVSICLILAHLYQGISPEDTVIWFFEDRNCIVVKKKKNRNTKLTENGGRNQRELGSISFE